MIEQYLTILSALIVIRGLLIFPYTFISRKTKLNNKPDYFILHRAFRHYDTNTWRIFWLAALWLIVRYYENILW